MLYTLYMVYAEEHNAIYVVICDYHIKIKKDLGNGNKEVFYGS